MGPVPALEAGLPGKDTPHTACSARQGSLPGTGHMEEISSGRKWPREAGTQPANHPQRIWAEITPSLWQVLAPSRTQLPRVQQESGQV